uniref:hypothetical protein n=1 Tax=Klebsiella pneumoniae TaxID=573 RepID=UPI0024DE6BC8
EIEMPWISDDDDGIAGAGEWGESTGTEGSGRLPSVVGEELWVGLGRALRMVRFGPLGVFQCLFFSFTI